MSTGIGGSEAQVDLKHYEADAEDPVLFKDDATLVTRWRRKSSATSQTDIPFVVVKSLVDKDDPNMVSILGLYKYAPSKKGVF